MRDEIVDELARHRLAKGGFGERTIFARHRQHADLILDLDHDDRVLGVVDGADVAQQGSEGPAVGRLRLRAESGQDVDALSVRHLRPREAGLVPLHPGRRIGGHAVLPGAEPEDDEPHVVRARVADELIDRRPVEASLLGLDQLPRHRREHRIQMHGAQSRPDRRHVGGARGAGIAELAADEQDRLAVDDQLRRIALPAKRGRVGKSGHGDARDRECRQDAQEVHRPNRPPNAASKGRRWIKPPVPRQALPMRRVTISGPGGGTGIR